jgi:RimJ/RimL family protein N-acetyltransferase
MILNTERLVLRPLCDDDRADMIQLLMDRRIKDGYMLPDYETEAEAEPMFERLKALSQKEEFVLVGIFDADGVAGFANRVSDEDGCIELGYVIAPEKWNRGYCTEAVKALIDALFAMGYREVAAGAFSHNAASMRVMEKAGMTRLEKTEQIEYRDENRKVICYSIQK